MSQFMHKRIPEETEKEIKNLFEEILDAKFSNIKQETDIKMV